MPVHCWAFRVPAPSGHVAQTVVAWERLQTSGASNKCGWCGGVRPQTCARSAHANTAQLTCTFHAPFRTNTLVRLTHTQRLSATDGARHTQPESCPSLLLPQPLQLTAVSGPLRLATGQPNSNQRCLSVLSIQSSDPVPWGALQGHGLTTRAAKEGSFAVWALRLRTSCSSSILISTAAAAAGSCAAVQC